MKRVKIIGCEEALKHLLAYLDQELGEERRREMARHLSICRGCFSRAEFEKRLKGQLREIGRASARSGFQKRIKALLDQF